MASETRDATVGPWSRAVLLVFALTLLLFTKDRADSWADGSRLGTIQALVENGTLALDGTAYEWQGDKVKLGSHYYSHQPPMMAMVGALPYAALHHGFGMAITDPWTYRALTWLLVGLPMLLGLWALARMLAGTGCGPRWQAAWLAIAAFGTLALPYSLVLNQHGCAAGLVLLALYASSRGRVGAAGVLLALATTIDLTAVFAALACAWPIARRTGLRGLVRYGLFAMPVLGLHFGVNWSLVGDLKPLGLHTEAFRYPLSPFMIMSLTGGGEADPEGTFAVYAWRALLGQSGLFSHHPALLIAVGLGLALPFRRGDRPAPGLLPAVGLLSAGIAAYYLTQSRNFGGSAFGMRWFTVFAPALVLLPAAWIGRGAPVPRPILAWTTALLALWSIAAAVLGALEPWRKIAYLPSQRSQAMIEAPEEWPGLREHWRNEWFLTRTWQQHFDRTSYERIFEEILRRLGKLYLMDRPDLSPEGQRAWIQEGIDKLRPFVDLLDRDESVASARPLGHFWLGKLLAKQERIAEARQELQRCLSLSPGFHPARKALEQLEGK